MKFLKSLNIFFKPKYKMLKFECFGSVRGAIQYEILYESGRLNIDTSKVIIKCGEYSVKAFFPKETSDYDLNSITIRILNKFKDYGAVLK